MHEFSSSSSSSSYRSQQPLLALFVADCVCDLKVQGRYRLQNLERLPRKTEVVITREIKEERGMVPKIQNVMQRRSL